MIKRILIAALFVITMACCSCKPKDGEYKVDIYAVSDIHGRFFSQSYTGGEDQLSLSNVSAFIKEMRKSNPDLILIDNGDHLQGDNAAFYFNYEEPRSPHIFPRIANYMKFDAVIVGNHDIEAGHPVYDRTRKEYKAPLLAANVVDENGKPYFGEYTVLKRSGLKVAIIGMITPRIKNWLPEEKYKGLDFLEAEGFAQNLVDRVIDKEKPDIVIIAIHAGTGDGTLDDVENPALRIAENLRGVDLVISGHDHIANIVDPVNFHQKSMLMNSGARAQNVAKCEITLVYEGGRPVEKEIECSLIPMAGRPRDAEYDATFAADFEKVKAFTNKKVGTLTSDIDLNDVFDGPSAYVSLLHKVQLDASGAQLSFAAPLGRTGVIKSGDILYNDLFSIYPYENMLYKIKLSGRQVKDYLEYVYDNWVNGRGPTYNLDSAAGINYKVYRNKPKGERVEIESLENGEPFDMDAEYTVAVTSYRAMGGGNLLSEGAGVDTSDESAYVVDIYEDIRDLIFKQLADNPVLDPAVRTNWSFVEKDAISQQIADFFGVH
ncbi:MAG: bifunctional metallophosphatase/5'-nucleotidase [Bacteroidales bacterium]|nr:bifunctional metallophosphatase/5'-nucleotidase [Bacteroidales bacterium]